MDTYSYKEEELKKMGDAILWTTILAAVHQDGVISREERAEAIKQTHIRTFSSADYLRPIYDHLDAHFERDFDVYSRGLPENQDEQKTYIQNRLAESLEVLDGLGPIFSAMFSKDLRKLYHRVFHAESNVFQIFAFPLLSAHLTDAAEEEQNKDA
ncbi:MAG: hypothetical protein WEC59_00530 [Salibacteraceae bacterium]